MSSNLNEYFVKLAEKWSKILRENHVYEANRDSSRPKFYVTAAFMYPNGPIHIGHGRTYLVADILTRFKRVMGYNVLFPMGFHYTGTPIITMAEAIAAKDRELIELFKHDYDVSEEDIERMLDPLYMARYFHNISKEVMNLYGLSIDWRREFTTIDPEFVSFIHWQFVKLYDKNYIEKGSHPVGWCPKHGMPVGMHDTKGDVEPEIGEFVAIFFKDLDGVVYPTATLRPETIFGVTNIWINPSAKYMKIKTGNGSIWIVGIRAAERLLHQLEFEVLGYIEGKELIGKRVVNPITGEQVLILPASFVDDSFATGIVMSVPAHAPYDAVALEDLKMNPIYRDIVASIVPRIIIETDGRLIANAYEALKNMGIESQSERDKLDDATRYVYSLELRNGCMATHLHTFVPAIDNTTKQFIEKNVTGKSVLEVREVVRKFIIDREAGVTIYELLNKPVYCRCGTEVVVKLLKDQWFINYGDSEWKKKARATLAKMKIVPEESVPQFEATIEWLKKRACARTRGLGVPFPWDRRWIIESLSDSTIYMAFYTVVNKIRYYGIPVEKLTIEFWDYVMLGLNDVESLSRKLSIPIEVIEDIRNEFRYWYPLDMRISGKDLIPNHLTFFIFNHIAIFPEELQPRGIIANGWVLVKQMKMSKSLRNIIPLKRILNEYGTDIVRLFLALGAEVYQDENIDPEMLETLGKKEYPQLLKSIHDTVLDIFRSSEKFRNEMNDIDRLFWNEFVYKVNKIVKLIDDIKIREAGIIVFYDIKNLIDMYLKLADIPHRMILDMLRIWIPLISIYTPFIAEEIWSKTFKEGFASTYTINIPSEIDEKALLALRYAEAIVSSVQNIIRATKKSSINNIVIYISSKAHQKIMRKVIELHKQGLRLNEIINRLSEELGLNKREASQLVRSMYDVAMNTADEIEYLYLRLSDVDELELLKMSLDYLSKVMKSRIEIYSAEDLSAPDKGGKKKSVLPLRPGIYIE
ncbi:MAG: leucine--tRNA ligase [Ignisphaera sp.]|uniref:Leucine--tRNA ligase n=1 Tax=Ignisphaera aggregans TaxID=334771 RepID=A0A7J3MX90_9CREN